MDEKLITPQLRLQALFDLTMRAKAGIYIYLAIWLVFVFAFDLYAVDKVFVISNTVAIAVISAARLFHAFYVKRATEHTALSLYQILVGSVLASALHWGILTAWALSLVDVEALIHLMLIVLPAFAMGGASTLSISNALRFVYPIFMFAPSLVAFFFKADPLSMIYAICISVSYVYVIAASKSTRENYWSSIHNQLIAEERAAELEKISITDPLTQLKNRMYFDTEYEKEWRRAIRLQSSISLIMIDLDHFKRINDNYGHVFGDEVLKRTAALISNEIKRPTDFIARYGGEEFVILLPNTGADGAKTAAERIRVAVEALKIEVNNDLVNVTCSIGGASIIPSLNLDRGELLKRADSALYEAKNAGRNCYVADQSAAKVA